MTKLLKLHIQVESSRLGQPDDWLYSFYQADIQEIK